MHAPAYSPEPALATALLPPPFPSSQEMREFLAAEEESAREKSMVDAILSKIRAEDEADMAARVAAREETIRVIEEFKEQRHRALEAQREAEREEERRIAAYMTAQVRGSITQARVPSL